MGNIINNIIKGNTDINDEVITGNLLGSSKIAADAYLTATMTCATPELRSIYSTSLSQIIENHSALTDLAVNRGWEAPYRSPDQQLADAYNKSKSTVEIKQ